MMHSSRDTSEEETTRRFDKAVFIAILFVRKWNMKYLPFHFIERLIDNVSQPVDGRFLTILPDMRSDFELLDFRRRSLRQHYFSLGFFKQTDYPTVALLEFPDRLMWVGEIRWIEHFDGISR